jgi:hypothetical protein
MFGLRVIIYFLRLSSRHFWLDMCVIMKWYFLKFKLNLNFLLNLYYFIFVFTFGRPISFFILDIRDILTSWSVVYLLCRSVWRVVAYDKPIYRNCATSKAQNCKLLHFICRRNILAKTTSFHLLAVVKQNSAHSNCVTVVHTIIICTTYGTPVLSQSLSRLV